MTARPTRISMTKARHLPGPTGCPASARAERGSPGHGKQNWNAELEYLSRIQLSVTKYWPRLRSKLIAINPLGFMQHHYSLWLQRRPVLATMTLRAAEQIRSAIFTSVSAWPRPGPRWAALRSMPDRH